jgi:hypothetical protein
METELNTLKELVNRHKVCWKVWPEYVYVRSEKRQIGYELELAGTHEPGVKHPEPGCEDCQHVFTALRQIAEYILPREKRPSMYEIGQFNQAITYSRLHANRPDVILSVKVLHRHGYERPVDECEDRCLKEMEDRLRDLGACRLQWSEGHNKSAGGSK